jgi:hypothetical protein
MLAHVSSAQLDGRYSSSAGSADGEMHSDSSSDLGEDDYQQQYKEEEEKSAAADPTKAEEKVNPFQDLENLKKAPIMNLPSVLDTYNPLKKFYASISKTKPKQAINLEKIVKE